MAIKSPFVKPTSPATPAALPAYLGGGTPMTYPQAMPGQLEAIAAQLAAGFGGTPQSYMQNMDALYNPVYVPFSSAPQFAAPQSAPATAPAAKPTSPASYSGKQSFPHHGTAYRRGGSR